MSDDGNWLTDAVSDGVETVRETTRSFLGVEREQYVCPECNVACEESHAYDTRRAAFDGGTSPSWYCEECGSHYVREADDSQHALDLYGRSPPE